MFTFNRNATFTPGYVENVGGAFNQTNNTHDTSSSDYLTPMTNDSTT